MDSPARLNHLPCGRGENRDVEINKNSVFEIASITKAITRNLVAQAALAGKLKLSAHVEDYLPRNSVSFRARET